MDAGDLRVFEAVARLGGMNRAGAELHTVQSNVTSRIRLLEEEIGARLFHRHSRGVALTPAGSRLLPYAQRVGRLLDEALRAARDDGRPKGPLVLGSLETTAAVRTMMGMAAVSFAACAVPLSFLWYFAWRFASGFAGGALMALAAPAVLQTIPPSRRGLAGGVIFTGVGLGIVASGTLVPLLLRAGLVATWLGLGAVSMLLTAFAWSGWPAETPGSALVTPPALPGSGLSTPAVLPGSGLQAGALLPEYGLIAVGLVPHMVFLVDFIARGLGQGLGAGAGYWVLFGLGATAGPVTAGAVADRAGFRRTLRLALLVQAAATAIPALTDRAPALALSSLAVGACVPGVVVLVLGRLNELVAPEARRAAWGWATIAFALGQAAAAYGFSWLFAAGAGYAALFLLGAGAFLAALAIDLGAGGLALRRSRGAAVRNGRAAPACRSATD